MSSPWPYRLHLHPPQRECRVNQIREFARHFTTGQWKLEKTSAGTVCLLFREEADFKLVAAWLKLGCRPDEGEVLGTNLTTGELRKI